MCPQRGLAWNPWTGDLVVADPSAHILRRVHLGPAVVDAGTLSVTGPLSATLKNLLPSTTYYVRPVAWVGSFPSARHGDVQSFTTSGLLLTMTLTTGERTAACFSSPPLLLRRTDASAALPAVDLQTLTLSTADLQGVVRPRLAASTSNAFELSEFAHPFGRGVSTLAGVAGVMGGTNNSMAGIFASFTSPKVCGAISLDDRSGARFLQSSHC